MINTQICSCNKVCDDKNIVFANSASQHTQKIIDIAKPTSGMIVNEYEIVVYNPSTASDLTVKVFTQETFLNGATKYSLVDTLQVGKSASTTGTTVDCRSFRVDTMFISGNCRLIVSNDTALGEAEGFTATIRITEII
jgi:hypothetical protein